MDTLPPHAQDGNPSCIEIPLKQGKSGVALVSPEDADLAQLRWFADKDGYAMRQERHSAHRQIGVKMHRIILERKLERPIQAGMWADHMNGDVRDNRRENLREVTPSQNALNRRSQSSHEYKGICFEKNSQKWVAYLMVEGKNHTLGKYDTPEEAALAYDRAALMVCGEYAKTNNECVQMTLWHPYLNGNILPRNNTSGYRGVIRFDNQWRAYIYISSERKQRCIGYFATAREAAYAYDEAAKLYHGSKAKLNFPEREP